MTDKERLDWIEAQSNGFGWVARRSTTGRGYRLHNDFDAPHQTAREAIDAAIEDSKRANKQVK